ncbi:MAG: tetratricopeptide repeat protein [Candidatus Eisenbacteria bacterium]
MRRRAIPRALRASILLLLPLPLSLALSLALSAALAQDGRPQDGRPQDDRRPQPPAVTIPSPGRPAPPPSGSQAPIPRITVERGMRDVQVLMRQEKFEQAYRLIETLKEQFPDNPDLRLLEGTCLRKMGRLDEARALYRKAADERIEAGGDPTPLLVELERVAREAHHPEEAFSVCLEIHRRGGAAGVWVRDEMESLIRADSLGEKALPPLRAEIEKRPEEPSLRELLVAALLFLGRADESIDEAKRLDEVRGAKGKVMLSHLALLDEREMKEPVLRAADLAASLGLSGEDLQQAQIYRASALRRLQRYPEADAAFRQAYDSFPRGRQAFTALEQRARMLADEQHDAERAAAAYQEIVSLLQNARTPDASARLAKARLALAEMQLAAGRYEEARQALHGIEEQASDPAGKEEAVFQQAEILFYSGKTEEAKALYERIVKEFEGGTRVNDALDRILLLTRIEGSGDVTGAALGQVAYQRRIGSFDRGLEIVREASSKCDRCPAEEDLLREESLLLLDLGRLDEAAARADTLAARHADGFAAPPVLRAVADKMREKYGDSEAVVRRYEDLILKFPKSHEASEVRPLLQDLRRTGRNAGGAEEKKG